MNEVHIAAGRSIFCGLLRSLFACLFLLPVRTNGQTNISGVINQYAKVGHISTSKDRVQVSANVFSANDKVLVIQMKGASINTANTVDYGTVTALNSAGYYEYSTVRAVSKDTVYLSGPLCRDFNPEDSVQMVKVPVYPGDVNVTGQLTCPAWSGTGGVLVFEVGGTLTLNADIDAGGNGFRGAQTFANGFICNNNTYYQATPTEGLKGEGIAHYVINQFYGRGKLANGGGGASAGNSGAGGGGNYGAGGKGGNQYSACGGTGDYAAIGGSALSYTSERVFMGGGGGGPQRDNGQAVYPGGNGGGIIIIKAGAIQGNGHTIRSDGQHVATPVADEGTSGGGAGGSIYLLCDQYSGPLELSAKGGNGGSTNNIQFATACHGPAGGGGGGIVWLSAPSLPAGVTTAVNGGGSGMVLNPASPCYNTAYESRPGDAGAVLFGLKDGFFAAFGLPDTLLCSPNTPLTLDIGTGYSSILWSTGETTPSITVNGIGTYYVQAVTGLGCIVRDTAHARLDSMTLGADTTICQGLPLMLSPSPAGNFVSYQWQDGSTASTLQVAASGTYYVRVRTRSGCDLSDTIRVVLDSIPLLRDTVICGDEVELRISMPVGHASYLWSTGETTSSILVMSPGIYTVETLTPAGCTFRDTVSVSIDTISLGNDTLVCESVNYTLLPQPAAGITSYEWQDGSTMPDYAVTEEGVYYVTVQTVNGCTLSDTVYVEVDSLPSVRFTVTDSILCEGRHVLFVADRTGEGLLNLEWDQGNGVPRTGTDSFGYIYDQSGIFTVKLTGRYRVCPDDSFSMNITIHPYPVLDLGPDTAICPNGEPVYLADQQGRNADAEWLWSTGESANAILVNAPGDYYATVTVNGCSTTDSIRVLRSCFVEIPNIFTPNGDGINDYFFPKNLLSRALASFKMQVFNRWGQIVFETTRPDGRGWDGRFNDKPQEQGVYIYMIEAAFTNGVVEKHQGNVTLLK